MATHAQRRKANPPVSHTIEPRSPRFLSALLGAFFGLCLLKFSNPPIMEKYVDRPASVFEAMATNPWPIAWAYWLLGFLAVAVIAVLAASAGLRASVVQFFRDTEAAFPSKLKRAVVFLPVLWLAWQFVSSLFTLSHELSTPTVIHYAA